MEQYYLVLLAFLAVIAVINLFVGVSNDAVNFQNMSIRCCEFYLSFLLVLRELINHYEIASLLEEQIGLLEKTEADKL